MAARTVSQLAGPRGLRLYSSGRGVYVVAMARPWRPEMDDVDRLSKGGAAKRRGTGSFHIPHRLNSDERPVYEGAKIKGFLQVRGTGYRKGRKGHPLPNIYRQWCDAKAQPCIIIEQDASGSNRDVVVVDLAPLRSSNLSWAVDNSLSMAAAAGARRIDPAERPFEAVPFDAIPVNLPHTVEEFLSGAGTGSMSPPREAPPSPEAIAAAEQQVAQQADAVRELKGLGLGNSHPEVQAHVQALIQVKADLQQLLEKAAAVDRAAAHSPDSISSSDQGSDSSAVASSSDSSSVSGMQQADSHQEAPTASSRPVLDGDHPFANVAIWQLPVMPLFFEADRAAAKQLAKDLMAALKV